MPKKVTLQDVADLANVAIGTASQALSGKGAVQPETRARILEAAQQLGYGQRYFHLGETQQKLKTIGVIKHDSYDRPGLDPFYFPVISGLEQECQRFNLSMMYATVEVDENNRALRLPPILIKQRLDGVVVIGAYLNEKISASLQALGCPVILVDGYSDGPQFHSILTNNEDGAFQAVRYLIECGHKEIGLIGSSPNSYPSIIERRSGYFRAMQKYGLSKTYAQDGLLKRDAAEQDTIRLLQKHPQLTALFVCNDNCAFGVINGARSLGINVPEQISVIGFDDIAFAQDMTPPLTTMHIDKLRLGQLAVQMLLFLEKNPDAPRICMSVDAMLIKRKSVAHPPR